VHEISRKQLGMTAVLDGEGRLAGIFTDGDLRRLLERGADARTVPVDDVMTRTPLVIDAGALAAQAARMLDAGRRNQLLVVDPDRRVIGALHMHDLMGAKVI